jgi:diacylglycerol O-acyltransferase / wax synthase
VPSIPMSPQDSLWLFLDRPTNVLAITSVLWTSDPIDPGRLRKVVEQRLLDRYPVFRRRAVVTGTHLRSARWEDDPDFDLDRHLLVRPMPAPGDRAALQDYVAAQRSVTFDPAHPRWAVHLLQGYGPGSAVVQRYHHAMADGIRLTQVMLSILDAEDRTPAARVGGNGHRHDGEHLSDRVGALVRHLGGGPLLDVAATAAAVLPEIVRPGRVLDVAADTGSTLANTAGSVAKILGRADPDSALGGEPGVAKTAVWGDPVPLTLLAGIGHATGTTVNDVCVALVAGAVGRYLAERPTGDDVGDLAWLVPVNLEPFDDELPAELGNHFSVVLAVLPHGIADFSARLAEVHRRMVRIRDSFEPQLTYATQLGIAVSPTPIATRISDFITEKAVGVLTNVPGPRVPMVLAGARVEGVVGWAPCNGRQSLTVCIFSYAGRVSFGFGTDRTILPDPEWLVAALDAEVAAATAAQVSPLPPTRSSA